MLNKEIINGMDLDFIMKPVVYNEKSIPLYQNNDHIFAFSGRAKKTLCLTNYFRNFQTKLPHSHKFYEIELCMNGEISHSIYDKTRIVGPNTAIFIPPGETHSYQIRTEYADVFTVMFAPGALPTRLESIFFGLNNEDPFCYLEISKDDFHRIISLCGISSNLFYFSHNDESFRSLIAIILEQLYEQYHNVHHIPNKNDFITKVDTFIRRNLHTKLTVTDIANHMSLETKYTSAKYSRLKGMTLVHYINAQKISAAKMLLTSTNLKIIDISSQCGFDNLAYFNKRFLREMGITPSKYRKTYSMYDIRK